MYDLANIMLHVKYMLVVKFPTQQCNCYTHIAGNYYFFNFGFAAWPTLLDVL